MHNKTNQIMTRAIHLYKLLAAVLSSCCIVSPASHHTDPEAKESIELDAWTMEKVQTFIQREFGNDVAQKFKGNRMA